MKKRLLIIIAIIILPTAMLTIAIYLSFWQVLPTTQKIRNVLSTQMTKIVRIPENLGGQVTYDQTLYTWEMETPQKEVTKVVFSYDHAYSQGSKISATLQMPEGEDASIFNKVLPAVITDEQSLISVQSPKQANLQANAKAGYENIALVRNTNGQTTKISWVFEKETIADAKNEWVMLKKYNSAVLRKLYKLPAILVSLAGG